MASKSFTLADTPDSGGNKKCCLYSCIIGFVGILGVAGIYVYQTTYGSVCSCPELDEHGLSNWTSGSEFVAYACFPGYFLEGESDLVVAKCNEGEWNPIPPSCNSLPLRIDCQVHNQSLVGNITMWQESIEGPTYIHGIINYTSAIKPQGHVMEHVILSKRTCNISHELPEHPMQLLHPSHIHPEPKVNGPSTSTKSPEITSTTTATTSTSTSTRSPESTSVIVTPETSDQQDEAEVELEGKFLRIQFNSSELKAFKKTDVFMNIIFVDQKTTATLVSVHQENLTLVMTNSEAIHSVNSSWNMDKGKKSLLEGMGVRAIEGM